MEIMNDIFIKWLSSGNTNPCYIEKDWYTLIIIRLEKSKNFDYLFCQKNYNHMSISNNIFEYVGIYYKQDNSLYDVQYELRDIVEDFKSIETKSKNSLLKQLEETVRYKVENLVNNDRNNLQITELKNSHFIEVFNYTKYSAERDAREFYFNNKPIIFQCSYVAKFEEKELLFEYILDPENYAQKEAETYIFNNQENILCSLLCNDIIRKEYETISKDTKNPIHTIKKIKNVMENTSAKTVNVTILKNDIEFTFKTEVTPLLGICQYNLYETHYIVSKDRHRFEQAFGSNVNYKPQEIIRITYKKNILYEAKKV